MSKIAKSIAAIAPRMLLPNGTKAIADQHGGRQVVLNTQEQREFLERNLTHHLNQFLNKYSPTRRTIQFYKKQRLKRKQDQFYCLIGQIALTHAAIEQDLKNTLMVDWEVPEQFEEDGKTVVVEKCFGEKLKKRFLKEIKKRLIPDEQLNKYKALYKEFWALSEKRNKTLKALYSFNQDTAEVSQIHQKNHGKYDGSMTYEEMVNSWMPKTNISELEKLHAALVDIRQRLANVRGFIFTDKIKLFTELCSEIGKTYPLYARQNPYLYKASLEQEAKLAGK